MGRTKKIPTREKHTSGDESSEGGLSSPSTQKKGMMREDDSYIKDTYSSDEKENKHTPPLKRRRVEGLLRKSSILPSCYRPVRLLHCPTKKRIVRMRPG